MRLRSERKTSRLGGGPYMAMAARAQRERTRAGEHVAGTKGLGCAEKAVA